MTTQHQVPAKEDNGTPVSQSKAIVDDPSSKSRNVQWWESWPAIVVGGVVFFPIGLGLLGARLWRNKQGAYATGKMETSLRKMTEKAMKGDTSENIQSVHNEIFEQFNTTFGSTAEEREKNIKKWFDDKKGIAIASDYYMWDKASFDGLIDLALSKALKVQSYVCFRIKRSLASMEQREREFLRTTYLLFNKEVLSKENFRYYTFALINGNGKASIDYHSWHFKDSSHPFKDVKDGVSLIKAYQEHKDASVDSAINHLLHVIESLKENNPEELRSVTKEIDRRVRGGGSWLSEEDVNDSIFSKKGQHDLFLGHLDDDGTPVSYSGEGSLITIAPPGSGKTQCFVLPNMLNWKGGALVLDIKGEIYAATHKWRETNVGQVYKFSPLDPANSNSYNPLVFVRNDVDYIWEDARFLADMMIVPSGSSEPFWENMARDVLTAAIAHVTFNNEPQDRAMAKVLDIIYGIGWDAMVVALKTNVLVASMRRMGNALEEMEKKQRDSVLKTAQSSLSAWQGERIAKVTSRSDWNPMDLRNGSPTVYICINPNEIDSYLSVLRVFIAQHIRMLTTKLPDRDSSPVLFMLDELPRLKKMPPVDEALNIGRQYGIKLWMFAQSYGQLKDAYPDPEGLVGSCAVRTYMNLPLNDEITTKISDQLGFREGPLDASKQKLVEPLELAGPNYRDIILVLASNTKPAKLKKRFAYEDPELAARMN